MASPCPTRPRKVRSDVERNRDRLLTAAKEVFAAGGGASLEAVARTANVGVATLYRHFPTREALYEAVYRREVDQLVAQAAEATDGEPVEDLRRWLHGMIDMVATKKGMLAGLALAVETTSAISARATERLTGALDMLLRRAVEAGRLRSTIAGEDLLLAVVGMALLRNQPGWQANVVTLADALIDGLRLPGDAA